MDTAVISGVGPLDGIGARLCLRFASLGLHVLVAGRTQIGRASCRERV